MTPATLSAILLLAAALVHSFSLMCRKLPPAKRPPIYPGSAVHQLVIDLTWVVLFLAGARLAFSLTLTLGIAAVIIYFVVLPFVFQPPMARMMGYRNLRAYLDAAEGRKDRK